MANKATEPAAIENSEFAPIVLVLMFLAFGAAAFLAAYMMYAPSNADKDRLALLEKDAKAYQMVNADKGQRASCVVIDTQLSVEKSEKTQPEYTTFSCSSSGGTVTTESRPFGEKRVLLTKVIEEQTLKCHSVVQEAEQEIK